MNTLILDCSAGMSVYLLKDGKTFCKIDNNQKKHTDELLFAVDELVNEAGIKIKDLNNLCVCVGPGSFTGIRVAISVCKGLAIGTNAKVFVCSNFDLLSFGETEKSYFVLDGFSDYIYVREFDGISFNDSCKHFGEFVGEISNNMKIVTNSEKVQNQLKNDKIECFFAENKTIDVFKEKIENDEFVNVDEIMPIYLRASQAEIERENKIKCESR